MRAAYFGFPHLGGTFQVFRHLRSGLKPLGITVQWIGLGEKAYQSASKPCWSAEMAHGFVVGAHQGRTDMWARQLVSALEAARFDVVFINVLSDPVQTNLARYLPPDILRVLIVHNITPGTYSAARLVRDHVHATVAISPRVKDDLTLHHGFEADRVVMIPHGIAPMIHPARMRDDIHPDAPLRVLYLGRIEDQAKGVLLLPRIFRRLSARATLTVAGDGPDLATLMSRCRGFGERVRFLGPVRFDDTGALFGSHDVMIMPSRFEGFGLALVEAMAAGCVPVAARIRGVTDFIVRQGDSGLLFPVGNCKEAARQICLLDRNRTLLHSMSQTAIASTRTEFSCKAMASRYQALLHRIAADPPPISQPLDIARWEMPKRLHVALRTLLPAPVKNVLRRVRESAA